MNLFDLCRVFRYYNCEGNEDVQKQVALNKEFKNYCFGNIIEN
jgi:hypothetical protein